MKVVKKPRKLDVENTYNTLFEMMCDNYNTAKNTFNDSELTLEQKQTTIHHLDNRTCGICDVIRELGYEIRTEDGRLFETEITNKFFGLVNRVDIEIRRANRKKEEL